MRLIENKATTLASNEWVADETVEQILRDYEYW